MCGIFGAVLDRGDRYSAKFLERAVRVLAREAESRGKDSSGLVFRDMQASTYAVYKGSIPIKRLLASSEVTSALARQAGTWHQRSESCAVIGHSRLVTNGSQLSDDNNQPVVRDGIIGVHNGIIVNDAQLWERHPALRRHHEIDTEVLLALVRERLEAGDDPSEAIRRASEEIVGTVSTALLIPDHDVLALFTNNGSLYTLTNQRDALFFASDFHSLDVLARTLDIAVGTEWAIEQLAAGSRIVCELATFRIKSLDDAVTTFPQPAPPTKITVCPVAANGRQLELVPGVAAIARAPGAARFDAMLEHDHTRVDRLRRCSRCVLPETFPFIEFDPSGVCNYCRNYRVRNQPKPMEDLLALVEPYRRRDGRPDCIVPFSGGRDSTFALHTIKTTLGLNPIAFTYDWGMVTDLGRRNIARVCGKLKVENIIVAADIHWKRRNIRKNLTAWLRKPHLGMIPLFMAGDKYFYYYIDQVKRQTDIRLNVWGINPMENTDFKVGFLGVPPDFEKKHIYSLSLRRQARLLMGVGGAILSNPHYLNGSVPDTIGSFLARSVKQHRDYYHLFDYLRWDEDEIDRLILDEYEWEKAIDTDTTWRIGDGTAAFYNYVYFTVAGFSEHDTFRSNQIREGVLSRDEALLRIARENRPRYPTIKWYLDAVGIDFEPTIRTVNAMARLY